MIALKDNAVCREWKDIFHSKKNKCASRIELNFILN